MSDDKAEEKTNNGNIVDDNIDEIVTMRIKI